MMARNKKILLKLLGMVLCATLLLIGCENNTQQEATAPLRQVRSIVIDANKDGYTRTFSGTLHAVQETKLSFKVAGTIKDIFVNIADKVKKGAIVAVLDSMPYDLQAQQAHAALINTQAQLRNAKSNYERVKNLYEGGNSSKNDLDNARANAEASSASVQSALKVLEIARLDVAYTKLKVKEDCAIASVDAEVGENVSSGTQIFNTTCGDALEVRLNIPETVIGSIKKSMNVTVRFSALPDKVYQAVVHEVGISTVEGGTTFPVRVILNKIHLPDLKAGLSADVTFSFPTRQDKRQVVLVPSFAVGEDEAGRFVFILERTGENTALVRRRAVTIGNIVQGGIEVLNGLEPNARIVTAGVSVLRDGTDVKFSDE